MNPPDIFEVTLKVIKVFEKLNIAYYVGGSLASSAFGIPHTTIDTDIVADIKPGQVWNMTFSFYHSLCIVPADMRQVASTFQFNWWQTLNWIEVPHAAIGLIWNSMMSMAGGWFFLMISEAFVLGHNDFRLPGVGSYMSVAVNHGNFPAMVYAIIAMIIMVVLLDLFLWRPVVAWSQKFKQEETGSQFVTSSFFLNWLRKSYIWQTAL